jgi:hypothetical protein
MFSFSPPENISENRAFKALALCGCTSLPSLITMLNKKFA